MKEVSFAATLEEADLIQAIVQRVEPVPYKRIKLEMDMRACHANGCRLDLERMARWKRDFDIVHDVYGIANNIDRTTGELLNLFVPRFAVRETCQ